MKCKILALILAILAIIGYNKLYYTKHYKTVNTNVNESKYKDIILDAGHGGFDGGAVAFDGTVEKDINLLICNKVMSLLQTKGFNVIMTRYGDSATDNTEDQSISKRKTSDLKNRLNLMQSFPNAVFISVHLNKFNAAAASGMQVFYSPNIKSSMTLADKIQSFTKISLQPQNERVIKQGSKSTYLLYYAKIPAVIVECGFLSNKAELAMLKDEKYQSKLAFCIFCGILNYYENGEV